MIASEERMKEALEKALRKGTKIVVEEYKYNPKKGYILKGKRFGSVVKLYPHFVTARMSSNGTLESFKYHQFFETDVERVRICDGKRKKA